VIEQISEGVTQHLTSFLLVLTRLSTLLMAMPAVGGTVPMRIRALLAIGLTALILPSILAPLAAEALPAPTHLIDLAIAVAREALIGMLIGTVVQLLMTGVQAAGEIITSTGGMQLGDAIDPTTRASMPTLARLLGLMVTAVMVAMGGHRWMLQGLLDSFIEMPPGQVVLHGGMMETILHVLSRGFAAGVRVAAPVVTALLLTNLITGLVSRTLPQINVLAIGLSINAMTLLMVSSLALGTAGWVFSRELEEAIARLGELW